jgi:multidrug resistance efflux pump
MNATMLRRCRSGHLRTHLLPALVWVAAVVCVVVLFRKRAERFEVVGLAQGRVHQIAATCPGRLKDVPVQLFDQVTQGQTLAVVDTVLENESIQAELDTALAEIEHLKAQLAPMREQILADAANLENDKVAAMRRFAVDVENARLTVLEFKALLESDRIMLEDLAAEVKIVQDLVAQDTVAAYELGKAKAQYHALAKKVEVNEQVLRQAAEDFVTAQDRLDEFTQRQPQHPSVDSALEVIRKAVTVQEKIIEGLLARRVPLELKTPFDGVVVRISVPRNQALSLKTGEDLPRMPGEVVMPGEPILTVAQSKPTEVVAYVGQEQFSRLSLNMRVELIRTCEPPQVTNSQVVCLGPAVELMPERLWQVPNIPQWGRPVLIKIPPGLKLIPGELVGIRGL